MLFGLQNRLDPSDICLKKVVNILNEKKLENLQSFNFTCNLLKTWRFLKFLLISNYFNCEVKHSLYFIILHMI